MENDIIEIKTSRTPHFVSEKKRNYLNDSSG